MLRVQGAKGLGVKKIGPPPPIQSLLSMIGPVLLYKDAGFY